MAKKEEVKPVDEGKGRIFGWLILIVLIVLVAAYVVMKYDLGGAIPFLNK